MSVEAFSLHPMWQDSTLSTHLPWYRAVASNQKPAKYLISSRIPIHTSLNATEGNLWSELRLKTEAFLILWNNVKKNDVRLETLPRAKPSLLDLTVELSRRILSECVFCQWRCKVDRSGNGSDSATTKGKLGTCQLDNVSRVGSYFHHPGEEIIYRGSQGSGTIFFTSCNMRCGFCQNGDISHDKLNGIEVTADQLALMAMQLRLEGVHNINLVGGEPTIHLHTVLDSISRLRFGEVIKEDLNHITQAKSDFPFHLRNTANASYCGEFNAPILWNSNFFMSQEAMALLRPVVDIWLPDFKFGSDKCAIHLSRTPQYWDTCTRNLLEIYRWGEEFSIRHLIMPNHVECCTKPCLDWVRANVPDALINVMDQYRPECYANPRTTQYNPKLEDISRRPTDKEIMESFAYAASLGLNYESLSYEKNQRGLHI